MSAKRVMQNVNENEVPPKKMLWNRIVSESEGSDVDDDTAGAIKSNVDVQRSPYNAEEKNQINVSDDEVEIVEMDEEPEEQEIQSRNSKNETNETSGSMQSKSNEQNESVSVEVQESISIVSNNPNLPEEEEVSTEKCQEVDIREIFAGASVVNESGAQEFFTPEERVVMAYTDSCLQRKNHIGTRKKVEIFGNLYCLRTIPLNKSCSKIIELGMDPNNTFDLVVRLKDKKTGLYLDMDLEGIFNLISEIENIIGIEGSDYGRSFYKGTIILRHQKEEIYELSQQTGLLATTNLYIHKLSLMNLAKIRSVFCMYASYYDYAAKQFISYIVKYVTISRLILGENRDDFNKNKMIAIENAINNTENPICELEKEFLAETLIKFSPYFESFF